jgi:hypothetical protein
VSLLKAKRFGQEEAKPKKEWPGRHSTTLSQEGENGYQECAHRFPALNQSELLELSILVLKDAPPTAIKKIYQGKDMLVEFRAAEQVKQEKKAARVAKTQAQEPVQEPIPGGS